MIRWFFASLALQIGMFGAALAGPGEVLTLLEERNFSGLERHIRTMHEDALETRDATDLRAAFALFRTTLPDRRDQVAAWRSAAPRSSYAVTAEAWLTLHQADLVGGWGEFRQAMGANSYPRWRDASAKAEDLAEDAVGELGEFAPALEVFLLSRLFRQQQEDFSRYADALVAVAPDVHSLDLILKIADEGWLSRTRDLAEICLIYAPKVDGIDRDTCIAVAMIRHRRESPAAAHAEKMLKDLTNVALDPLRREVSFGCRSEHQIAQEDAVALHQSTPQSEFDTRWTYAVCLDWEFELAGYAEAVAHQLDEDLEAALEADPYNYRLLELRARIALRLHEKGFAGALYDTRQIADNLTVYGDHMGWLWHRAAQLRSPVLQRSEIPQQQQRHERAIALSALDADSVIAYLRDLARWQETYPIARHQWDCPYLRIARIVEALCTYEWKSDNRCQAETETSVLPLVDAGLAIGTAGSCIKVQTTRLADLAYIPPTSVNRDFMD